MLKKILVVEDELIVAGDIKLTLEQAGYEVVGIARSVNRAIEIIDVEKPFLVLLDIYLKGDLTGINLATELNRRFIPFIYISANCNKDVLDAANVTHPYGFIVKPFRTKDLLVSLDIATYRYEQQIHFNTQKSNSDGKTSAAENKLKAFKRSAQDRPDNDLAGIVASSTSMLSIFNLLKQVAPTDTSVLILGESGTGKEMIANAIHQLSARKDKPFIKINCAALPESLIEAELFGYEKGAFTGSIERRIGKFEKADSGTIFLDEIGEMPLDMQVKLLRVLQEREIERIGGKEPITIDVRIMAATNRNLEKEIAEGRFRLDLYYRLYVFPIEVPPLREHKADISLLGNHFVQVSAKRIQKNVDRISDKALEALLNYSWPGNVRELQNVIERAVVLAETNEIQETNLHISKSSVLLQKFGEANAVRTIEEVERDHILDVLSKCNNKVAGPGGAAELLKLPVSTLASKMKKLGIVKKHTF